jgi:CSLREA domain-containing protein
VERLLCAPPHLRPRARESEQHLPGTALLHRAIRVEKWARSLNLLFHAVLVAATLGLLLGAKPAYAKTFTVDVTADLPDPEDNACVVSIFGGCTLRAAIQQANATSGADTISFGVPSTSSFSNLVHWGYGTAIYER